MVRCENKDGHGAVWDPLITAGIRAFSARRFPGY
jgi:hypothetical protein